VLEKVQQVRRDADHKSLQAMAQQLPSRAVDSGLHLVARAEETYEDLAERGAKVLSRRRESTPPTSTEPPVRRAAVLVEPSIPDASPAKAPGAAKPAATKTRKAAVKSRANKPTTVKSAVKPTAAAKTEPTEPAKPAAG
jgi:hypothetical protein